MISSRVSALSSSSTLKITALTKKLKKEGKDVVNFAAGEPDFDTPSFIKEKAKLAIDQGLTKYTPSVGTSEIREAICRKLKEENHIPCESSNIIVTAGAKYALFAAMTALLDRNEEALIPAPFWVSYPEMVKLCGAKVKIIKTKAKDNFKLSIDGLSRAISKKTKLLVLNYPSNPTGVTYNENELKAIYEAVKDKNIIVLSDEIYEILTYDGAKHISFASIGDAHKFTVTVNGFSKSFSMTGWRLGYLEGANNFIEAISKVIDHTTSCASSISQAAGLMAIQDKKWPQTMREEFEKRRNLLFAGLSALKKIKPIKPSGTFYMFCDIKKSGLSSVEFSSQLLDKHLVSTIPADSFGAEGYIRLSFATSAQDIEKGIDRIKVFTEEL
ncbi:MAG: pyridoxal phosphate-dependent aminotransferase [Candidatus Omnitrophica bacterium]|jgi:aspartate aminotransferase|nr:pyridoxal phosphate-dependent aminotransferase [Candidatus Omnitrophota bacterium]